MAPTQAPVRVFLSSTSRDLGTFREAVIRTIHSLPGFICVYMEDYGARDSAPIKVDDDEIGSCGFFLGILGEYYGSRPIGSQKSFTELEYENALAMDKRRLMFLSSPGCEGLVAIPQTEEDREKQVAYRSKVQGDLVTAEFKSPIDLVMHVIKALIGQEVTSAAGNRLPVGWADIPHPPDTYLVRAPRQDADISGRIEEMNLLSQWLGDSSQSVAAVHAIGGMGKSTLVRNWVETLLDPGGRRHGGVFWWSFYEEDSGFDAFLDEALIYVGLGKILPHVFLSASEKAKLLIIMLSQSKVLIVMDGFERELQAYRISKPAPDGPDSPRESAGCVNRAAGEFLGRMPGLPPGSSKVIMTTRLVPNELCGAGGQPVKGVFAHPLAELGEEDTVAWFRASGITATRAEIADVCGAFGFHPLTIRVIVGHILSGVRHRDAFEAIKDFDPVPDLVLRRNHVFKTAVSCVPPNGVDALSIMACFQYGVPFELLESILAAPQGALPGLERTVEDLVRRGLVFFDPSRRICDMHPVIREYVLGSLEHRQEMHERIRKRLEIGLASGPLQQFHREESPPVHLLIELFRQTALSGKVAEAADILSRQLDNVLSSKGEHLLARSLGEYLLEPDGSVDRRILEGTRASITNSLSIHSAYLGDPYGGARLLEDFFRGKLVLQGEPHSSMMENLAYYNIRLGNLEAAEHGLQRSISGEKAGEMSSGLLKLKLALISSYRGEFDAARKRLAELAAKFQSSGTALTRAHLWTYRVIRALHMGEVVLGHQCAKLAMEWAMRSAEERSIARSYYFLGAVSAAMAARVRGAGQLRYSEGLLTDALARIRSLHLVEFEAACLGSLSEIFALSGRKGEALEFSEEALALAQRCGYRFDEAEIWFSRASLVPSRREARMCLESAMACATSGFAKNKGYVVLGQKARRKLESIEMSGI